MDQWNGSLCCSWEKKRPCHCCKCKCLCTRGKAIKITIIILIGSPKRALIGHRSTCHLCVFFSSRHCALHCTVSLSSLLTVQFSPLLTLFARQSVISVSSHHCNSVHSSVSSDSAGRDVVRDLQEVEAIEPACRLKGHKFISPPPFDLSPICASFFFP